jgi:ribosomal-protein-serine acetyltransferase
MERETLRTARVELRPTGPELAGDIWAAIEASLTELTPWMPWAADSSGDEVRSFTERAVAQWESGTAYNFTMIVDGQVTGQCSLNRIDPLARSTDIGYWLRSDLARRGLASEAAVRVIEFGFDDARLHRIELHAGIDNVASNRIAQKLGFRFEGVMRGRGRGANGFYDMNLYALLADEARPSIPR